MADPNKRETTAAAPLVRKNIAAMAGYTPGEQPQQGGVVKLNTNENPYPAPRSVTDAITAACADLSLYPDPTATPLRRRLGELTGVDPDGIVVGNGSDELLAILIRAIVEPGEAVAYPVPTYSLYDTLVTVQGATPLHLDWPADWTLPPALFDCDARLRIVCNPNSPSGTVVPAPKLRELADATAETVLVIDEAYVDFAHEDALSLIGVCPNVVVLRTLSKSYSLAGLRVGFALTNPDLARELHKVRDSYNVNRLAQAGAMAALAAQDEMAERVEMVRRERARLITELRTRGYESGDSQANFVFARRPGTSLESTVAQLREQNVLVRWFRDLPDGMRVTVGTPAEIDRLLEALDAGAASGG